jgi:hypothetical protein
MSARTLRRIGAVRLLALASGAALLAAAALAGTARPATAQAPLAPRDANTCRASLTVSPNVVLFGAPRPVTVSARGLEPGVSYRLWFNNSMVSSGSVSPDGTVEVHTTIESAIALLVNVQVVTESRCAAGTATVAGPARVTCEILMLLGLPPFCVVK